jgi:hypothetical protein
MLNRVQHDKAGEFSVTLNHGLMKIRLVEGLMSTDTSVFGYGLWTGMEIF